MRYYSYIILIELQKNYGHTTKFAAHNYEKNRKITEKNILCVWSRVHVGLRDFDKLY